MLTIYEAIVLYRVLPKDELAASLKRTTNYVLSRGGFFRQLQFMGLQKCPWRQSKDGSPFWEANYFLWEFNMPKIQIQDLAGELNRDFDVIRTTFIKNLADVPHPTDFEKCTFEEEMLPVPYRPAVVELVTRARKYAQKKHRKGKLQFRTNIDFFPFQR